MLGWGKEKKFSRAARASFCQLLAMYRDGFVWEERMTGDGIFKLFVQFLSSLMSARRN